MPHSALDADPWINCVERGILDDLRFVVANQRWRAAMTLVYAGIDAIAYTATPEGQRHGRASFIAWANRYMRLDGPVQVPGEDLYGARCAILHSYGTESDNSRDGKCRRVLHVVGGAFAACTAAEAPGDIVVEVSALARAFIRAVEEYGHEASEDEEGWRGVTARLQEFNHSLPYED